MAEAQEKPQAKEAAAPLGSAAASSNPLVHQLLAERVIADGNGEKAALKVIDQKLADLGVSAEV